MLPKVIIHADWSSDPKKRWMCRAVLDRDVYRVEAPAQVLNPKVLASSAAQQAEAGGL